MLAKLLVHFYLFVHGKLHLPGAGWLIRRSVRFVKGLQDYPLAIPGVGTVRLDFRDDSALGMLNVFLGEQGDLAPLIRWLKVSLNPGAVLWDVGANFGLLDLWVVRNHPDLGSLHAFEPNPQALRSLQSLFQDHPKVRIHPVGLGARDETLELNVPRAGSLVGSLVRTFEGADRIRVRIRRGDAYCAECQLPAPQVIKIDVEGFEPQVFDGLGETIRRHRPVIFFEHVFLTEEQIKSLTPPDYSLRLVLDSGELTGDWQRRNEGHDAVLIPVEQEARWPAG